MQNQKHFLFLLKTAIIGLVISFGAICFLKNQDALSEVFNLLPVQLQSSLVEFVAGSICISGAVIFMISSAKIVSDNTGNPLSQIGPGTYKVLSCVTDYSGSPKSPIVRSLLLLQKKKGKKKWSVPRFYRVPPRWIFGDDVYRDISVKDAQYLVVVKDADQVFCSLSDLDQVMDIPKNLAKDTADPTPPKFNMVTVEDTDSEVEAETDEEESDFQPEHYTEDVSTDLDLPPIPDFSPGTDSPQASDQSEDDDTK